MIDLSDGLAADAGHIGRASGVQLRVELEKLPLQDGVAEICAELGISPWRLAAGAGEDYELCFCSSPEDRSRVESAMRGAGGVGITWVGTVADGAPGVSLLDGRGDAVRLDGFEHRW
jgi:thiamine-monophosphate kinase